MKLKEAEKKKKLREAQSEGNKKVQEFLGKLPKPLVVILGFCGIEKEKKKADEKPMSYKVLKKHISHLHPVDPLTNEKFSISESSSVYNYGMKLSDACFCMAIYQCTKKINKSVYAWFFKKSKKKIDKPESMQDVPDSGSGSDNQDSF